MKKTLLLLAISISCFANDNLFVLDESKVNEATFESSQLDNYLEETEIKSISELTLEEKSSRVYNLNNFENKRPLAPTFESIDDMNWVSFAWGFCCWPVGFFLVILNNNESSDSKVSYLIGVVFGIFVWGGAFWFSRGWWWWY
jgi:hypothetical protein